MPVAKARISPLYLLLLTSTQKAFRGTNLQSRMPLRLQNQCLKLKVALCRSRQGIASNPPRCLLITSGLSSRRRQLYSSTRPASLSLTPANTGLTRKPTSRQRLSRTHQLRTNSATPTEAPVCASKASGPAPPQPLTCPLNLVICFKRVLAR